MSHPGKPVLCHLPSRPLGLAWARDAVLSWALARSSQRPLVVVCDAAEPLQALEWLGLDWDTPGDGSLPAPTRLVRLFHSLGCEPMLRDAGETELTRAEAEAAAELGEAAPGLRRMARLDGTEQLSLEAFRRQGVVAEAVLATLAACGWQPSRGRSGLTRAEILVRFSADALGSAPVAWDQQLLLENHRLFLGELTPREMLVRTLDARLESLAPERVMELEGLALVYGEEVADLNQLRDRLTFYFQPPDQPGCRLSPEVLSALERVEPWDAAVLEQALEQMTESDREALQRAVVGRVEPFGADLLALLGRQETLTRSRRSFNPAG